MSKVRWVVVFGAAAADGTEPQPARMATDAVARTPRIPRERSQRERVVLSERLGEKIVRMGILLYVAI